MSAPFSGSRLRLRASIFLTIASPPSWVGPIGCDGPAVRASIDFVRISWVVRRQVDRHILSGVLSAEMKMLNATIGNSISILEERVYAA